VIAEVLHDATLAGELRRILDHRLVRSVYQPIVDLDTGSVVGYEALARGPVGSALERPDLLFATAHAVGAVAELEWACRAAAVSGALSAGLRQTLFVNVEPSLIDARCLRSSRRCCRGRVPSSTSCSSSPSGP
jgi:EAL domain-containing protein (putative c-di-GMP-specific phosphodiesterase class I)